MEKIEWGLIWNDRKKQVVHELYRMNYDVWRKALEQTSGNAHNAANYIINTYTRFSGVFEGTPFPSRKELVWIIVKHFKEVRKSESSSKRRTCPPKLPIGRVINHNCVVDANDTFWQAKLKDELLRVERVNGNVWKEFSARCLDETGTAISIIKNVVVLDDIYSTLYGKQRQDAINIVIGYFVHPNIKSFADINVRYKSKGELIWEMKLAHINNVLVEMHNGDKGIWNRYSHGNILCKDSAIKIIGDYTKLNSLTDGLGGDKWKKIVKMIIEFFTDETRETKVDGLGKDEWERRKFDIGLALECIGSSEWEDSLEEAGRERSQAAEFLIESDTNLANLTDDLSERQRDIAENIIIYYYTENIKYCTWERRKKEVKRSLRKLADEDVKLWEDSLADNNGDVKDAVYDIVEDNDELEELIDDLKDSQWTEIEKIVIDYFTVHHKVEPKRKVDVLSDHLRVDLVRVLESNDSLFTAVWKMGIDNGDDPYDVASKILTKYASTSYVYSKILDQGEISEANYFIIDYYTKGKGEEGMTKAKKIKLLPGDAKELKELLESDDFDVIWKEKIEEGSNPEAAANNILTEYNSTDSFFSHLDNIYRSAAVAFVINYFTKGEGVMGKIKNAVKETKEETMRAGGIVLKIGSGNMAIKNVKKLIANSIGMSNDHMEKFMNNPLVDVGIAQFGSFLMSLPQNDGKMTDTLKLVRECIILASTQTAFESLNVDKYIDKMLEGIDIPALKKLSKKNSVDGDSTKNL
jgi:predicted adenine nucleotide alpha hydrolase (AANH) superfamily ATPase